MVVLRAAVVFLLVAAASAAPLEGGGGGFSGVVPDLRALNPLHQPGGFVGRFGDLHREVLGGGVESEGFRFVGGGRGQDTPQRSDATVEDVPDFGVPSQASRPHDTGVSEGDPPRTGTQHFEQYDAAFQDIDLFQTDPQYTDQFQIDPEYDDILRMTSCGFEELNSDSQNIDQFQIDPRFSNHQMFELFTAGPRAIVPQDVDPLHVGAQDTTPLNVNSLDAVQKFYPPADGFPGSHVLGLKKTSEEDKAWPAAADHGRMIGIDYARN